MAHTAHAAGTAQVEFVAPANFSDAGRSSIDSDRSLAELAAHFEELARGLPSGQSLRIQVLDVDLAGEPQQGLHDLRVLRGMADPPRLHLRWSLHDGTRLVKSGEDRISDLGYLARGPHWGLVAGPLAYEKRMLRQWFAEQVAPGR